MRTPHTSCRKGKRVYAVLKNGLHFVDKFVERTGKYVIFENHRVLAGDLKVFAINRQHSWPMK